MRIRRTARGRHRVGGPGLRHVRAFPNLSVRPRGRPAHARRTATDRQTAARRLSTVVAYTAIAAVLVSGWFAASGATAIAQMVAR
jgi:hypothetical protein